MIINDGRKQDGDPTSTPQPKAVVPAPEPTSPAPAQQVAPVASLPVSGDSIAALMQTVQALVELQKISAAREARLIKVEEEAEGRKAARQKRDAASAAAEDGLIMQKQASCRHLKGGKYRMKTAAKDYSLIHHMFLDQSQYVKCVLCKMKWYPWDTVEALVRGGSVRKNHTKIGWREALAMMADSTNTITRSEIVIDPTLKPFSADDVPDTGNSLGKF